MKKIYYPEEYRKKSKKDISNDFGIVELDGDLEEEYGYLGIDTRENNLEGV